MQRRIVKNVHDNSEANLLLGRIKHTALQASDVVFGVDVFSPVLTYSKDPRHGATKISHYDFSWLLAWRYLMLWKDTAFSLHILLWTLVSCVAATLVGFAVCPPDKSQDPFWGSRTRCLPLQASNIWLFLTTLISFLLSIFTNLTLTRWWTMREKTGFCMGRMNNVAATITACMPGARAEIRAARETIVRYLNAMHAAMYITFKRDENLKVPDTLHSDGLITADELAFLSTTPNVEWNILLTWLSHMLHACAANGWILHQETMLPYPCSDLQVIRGYTGDIMGFLTCQIPYPYVALLIFITKSHILLVHIYAAALIGPNIWTPGYKDKDMVMLGYVILIFNCLIYNALMAIADMLYNPFGHDRTDFPVHLYTEAVKKSTAAILRVGDHLPAAIQDVQNATGPPQAAPVKKGGDDGQWERVYEVTSDGAHGAVSSSAVQVVVC